MTQRNILPNNRPPRLVHRGDTLKKSNLNDTPNYAIDCFNAILSQSVKAAMVDDEDCSADPKRCVCNKAADAATDKKNKCVPEPLCKCETSHDAVSSTDNSCKCEHDAVNHPNHYCQGGIECIDAIDAAVTGLSGMEAVCTGHVIRYIWRWKHKNGLQDLQKARFYLNKLILLVDRKGED